MKNFITGRKILLFFLFFILIKGTIWSGGISLFTLSDEITHFTYIQYLAEHKELPRSADVLAKLETSSIDLRKTLKILEVDKTPLSDAHLDFAKTREHGNDPNPISFHDFLNNPNLRANWSFSYPPLYYAFGSVLYIFGKTIGFDITSIAYLLRFSAIFFLIITVIFSYKTALILSRDRLFAIIVCSIIALMVSVNTVFSSINNDVALIAFSHIVLYLIYRIFYSPPQNVNLLMVLLFFAFLAAILSKPQAIIFVPLLVGALMYNGLKNKKLKSNMTVNILAAAAVSLTTILLLPKGFFSNFLKIGFGSINGTGEIITIIINDLIRRFNLVFDFFIQLGLFNSSYPIWIFSFLGVMILLSGLGMILFFYHFFKGRHSNTEKAKALLMCLIPFITLEILYTFLYYREAIINKVYDFPGQGRYYFIVLAPLIMMFVYGLQYIFELIKVPRRVLYYILVLFFAFLNGYFLIHIIVPSAYL